MRKRNAATRMPTTRTERKAEKRQRKNETQNFSRRKQQLSRKLGSALENLARNQQGRSEKNREVLEKQTMEKQQLDSAGTAGRKTAVTQMHALENAQHGDLGKNGHFKRCKNSGRKAWRL